MTRNKNARFLAVGAAKGAGGPGIVGRFIQPHFSTNQDVFQAWAPGALVYSSGNGGAPR